MLDQNEPLASTPGNAFTNAPSTLAPVTGESEHASPMEEATQLSKDLKRLLDACEVAHLEQDVKDHVQRLTAWTETYLSGLEAAQKLSDNATDTLLEAQKELFLSLDQYIRLEGEGGNTATPAQAKHMEEMARTLKHINKLIPAVETRFAAEPDTSDPEPEMNPEPAPESDPALLPDIPPVDAPEIKVSDLKH